MGWTFSEDLVVPLSWPPLQTGRYYGGMVSVGALATFVHAANVLYFSPFFVAEQVTVTTIGIEVTAFAAGNCRLGIYRDSAGVPGALVLDAGAVSTGVANGWKSIAGLSQVLTPGWYWLASVSDAGPTVRALAATTAMHVLGFSSGTDTTIHAGVSYAFVYAALPDPAGAVTLMTTAVPRVMIAV